MADEVVETCFLIGSRCDLAEIHRAVSGLPHPVRGDLVAKTCRAFPHVIRDGGVRDGSVTEYVQVVIGYGPKGG